MSSNHPKPGINHVPSYQQSGIPFVTRSVTDELAHASGKIINVKFPFVTKFFAISCSSDNAGNLRFGFTENGVKGATGVHHPTGSNNNFFSVKKGTDTPRLEIRCTELFFKADAAANSGFEIIAGLTTIPTGSFAGLLTGSNGFEGVG